jgi:hypothetical protein
MVFQSWHTFESVPALEQHSIQKWQKCASVGTALHTKMAKVCQHWNIISHEA